MARLRSIRRLFPRLVQVGHKRRALLAEAVLSLLAARATLIFVSFPQLARRLGAMVPPADARVGKAAVLDNYEQAFIAREVGWSVTRAACFMPFKAVCLQQAMAARSMLRRRGVPSVLHFGAARGETKPLDAHAWLDAAGVEVTGYPVEARLTEIACFVQPKRFCVTRTV
jgi:hypothetical protein